MESLTICRLREWTFQVARDNRPAVIRIARCRLVSEVASCYVRIVVVAGPNKYSHLTMTNVNTDSDTNLLKSLERTRYSKLKLCLLPVRAQAWRIK